MPRRGACQCNQCYTLAEYMDGITGEDYGLARAPGHGLGPTGPQGCDGTPTCKCERCTEQRALIVQHGSRDRPQPWEPQRAAA